MSYQCETDSPEGMVKLIAASFLRHGYLWFTTGRVPRNKDPKKIEKKLTEKYGLNITERERTRRKAMGLANAKLLRFEDWFILLVTRGQHKIKELPKPGGEGGEGGRLRCCLDEPIYFRGYSISYKQSGVTPAGGEPRTWHAHVRLDKATYKSLKAYFLEIACRKSQASLTNEFNRIPYDRYAPIRRQILLIHRAVNEARAFKGLAIVPSEDLQLGRKKGVRCYLRRTNEC